MASEAKKLKELRRKAAKAWIESNSGWIPKDRYDFLDMCEALSEPFTDVHYAFVPPPKSVKDIEEVYREKIKAGELPAKDPKTGDWDHVTYLPRWTDPDYTPNLRIGIDGITTHHNTVRDALYNLRPAVRLEDQIQNPTQYATRFGIADGRLDGRSRMSPSWSKTRNPFDDFANQVDMLDAAEHNEAKHRTREMHRASGTVAPPGEAISPQVMEDMLSRYGLLSNEQLVEEIEKAAKKGMSFEEMLDDLERRNPRIMRAHRVFLENVRNDQSYQRMICNGLTTDELITTNTYLITDDIVMDLDNDLSPLFARDKWESSAWKGKYEYTPKHLYSINGSTREAWDVMTNDVLWEAMLPSLRLATLLLECGNPIIDAIFDMNTRRPLPKAGEVGVVPYDPSLTAYCLQKDIDPKVGFPWIRELDRLYQYDWKANVMRILQEHLVFELSAYHADTGRFAEEYGTTKLLEAWATTSQIGITEKGTCKIVIAIAADFLWPLLVPQYSRTEKLITSFNFATTLVHELMHAVHMAQGLLIEYDWADAPGQAVEVSLALEKVGEDIHHKKNSYKHLEPNFDKSFTSEIGYDLEEALWGFIGYPAVADLRNDMDGPVDMRILPFGVLTAYFGAADSYGAPHMNNEYRLTGEKGGAWPQNTMPLEFMSKLFKKSFWEQEYAAYGYTALRIMPDNRIPKTLVSFRYHYESQLKQTYGKRKAEFILAVCGILGKTRQTILAVYLEALAIEAMHGLRTILEWVVEMSYWDKERYHPLPQDLNELDRLFKVYDELSTDRWDPDQAASFQRYWNGNAMPRHPPMTFPEWQTHVRDEWDKAYRDGGIIMRQLVVVRNGMEAELGADQLLVFSFLTLSDSLRHHIFYKAGPLAHHNESPMDRAIARMQTFGVAAGRIKLALNKLIAMPQLSGLKPQYEAWRDRFQGLEKEYLQLLEIVRDDADPYEGKPKDISWKSQFNRVPTFYWRPQSEQFEDMARREYRRVDPAVRKVIDDCVAEIKRISPNIEFTLPDGFSGNITEASESLASVRFPVSSLFDFTWPEFPPGPLVPTTRSPNPLKGAGISSQPKPAHQFGVPTSLDLNAQPARRRLFAALGGTRIQRTRKVTRSNSPYLKYLSGSSAPWDTALGSKAADLFKSGLPQPIAALLPERKQNASGSGHTPIVPFPNPYANRLVLTSELKAFREQKSIAGQAAQQQNNAAGIYTTRKLWRERPRSESASSDGSR